MRWDGEIEVSHQSDAHGVYKPCQYCHGTGRITNGYQPPSGDDEPRTVRPIVVDLDRFGFNPGGALSVIAAAILMIAVAAGAFVIYDNYLRSVDVGTDIWTTGVVLFGTCLFLVVAKLLVAVLEEILGSALWLTVLAGLMASYQLVFNDLTWWSAMWKSAVLFMALGLGWGLVFRSRLAVICLGVGGVFLWNWLFNGRFSFW